MNKQPAAPPLPSFVYLHKWERVSTWEMSLSPSPFVYVYLHSCECACVCMEARGQAQMFSGCHLSFIIYFFRCSLRQVLRSSSNMLIWLTSNPRDVHSSAFLELDYNCSPLYTLLLGTLWRMNSNLTLPNQWSPQLKNIFLAWLLMKWCIKYWVLLQSYSHFPHWNMHGFEARHDLYLQVIIARNR